MPLIRPTLDLTRYAWRQKHGDLVVFGTWRYDADENDWVPCMVILPALFRRGYAVPCIVTLDLAWIWSEEEGDPRYAAEIAAQFCEALGLPVTLSNGIRILSIVRDHIEDMVKRIPPKPPEKVVVADAILTNERGKQLHSEIVEDV